MKAKIISIGLFLLLTIVLPPIGQWNLLLSPYIFLLAVAAVILLWTQPAVTLEDTRQQRTSDRFSVMAIMSGSVLSIAVCVTEWARMRDATHVFVADSISISGILIMACGIGFRIWAIRTLGRFFTSTVKVQREQQVIQTGPYRLVRHPSYLGAYMAILGSGLMLHAYYGLLLSGIIMLGAYVYRIDVEEKKLISAFGPQYLEYQRKTKKVVPYIF